MRWLITFLCSLALLSVLVLYGGLFKPAFSMPAYLLLGLAGLGAVLPLFSRPLAPRIGGTTWFFLVWSGYLAWRAWHSPEPYAARFQLWEIGAGVVLVLLLVTLLIEPKWRLFLVASIIALASAEAVVGLAQFLVDPGLRPFPWLSADFAEWYGKAVRRARGTYANANHLAWLLNFSIFFSLAVLCWSRLRLEWRLLAVFALLLTTAALPFTLSRGGILAFAMGGAVFFFLTALLVFRRSFASTRWIGLGALVALLLLGGVTYFAFRENLQVQSRWHTLGQDAFRPEIWQAAFRQWQLDPLVGTGGGTSRFYLRTYRPFASALSSDPIYAHNDWLTLLAEYGWIGFAGGLVFLALLFFSGWRNITGLLRQRLERGESWQDNQLALQMGAMAFIAASAGHSLFDFNLQLPGNFLLAALAVGILLQGGKKFSSFARGKEEMAPAKFFGATIASCLSLAVSGALLFCGFHQAIPEWNALQAENALANRKIAEALQAVRQGIQADPHNPRLHALQGEARLQLAEQPISPYDRSRFLLAAAASFHRVITLSPMDQMAYGNLNYCLIQTGRWESAQKFAHQLITLDPLFSLGYEQLGFLADKNREFSEALGFYALANRTIIWSVWTAPRYRLLLKERDKFEGN